MYTQTVLPIRNVMLVILTIILACTFAVAPVKAQSTQQLQAQINQLLAQIAALQAQLAGGGAGIMTCSFTRTHGIGSSGPEVMELQKFLNRSADTRLAVSGAGSPGFETQYYGPITANAVSRFQVKYAAEVLAPLGLTSPTGYFGRMSLDKANEICSVVVTPPVDEDEEDEDEDEEEELQGGEAVLNGFEVDEGDDASLNEGQSSAPVMDVEFDVEDGDVRVDRIDVAFDHVADGDDEPWEVFDEVSIWVDDDQVAEIDASDEDQWTEDEPDSGDYMLRLTDVDFVVREGETAAFSVAVSVAGSVDDAETGVEWEMFIPDDGVRAVDSENLNHYVGDTDEVVSFDINEEGSGDELTVRSSDDDPEAGTLQLDDTEVSDWQTIFAFELDADDSTSDIEVESLPITIEFSDSTYADLVNDAVLVIDGEEYDDFTVTNENSNMATLTFEFDSDDLIIDSGESLTVELMLEFEALEDALEGTTVQSSIDGEDIEAEGADELDAGQIGGSATSETHELRTSGVSLSLIGTEEDLQQNTSGTTSDDEGIFRIEFEVTASEQDIYVDDSVVMGTTNGTAGVNYIIVDGSGDAVVDGSVSGAILSSTADETNGRYHLDEGDTEEFTLIVEFDPETNGFYQLQLYSFNYNDTNADPDTFQRALPAGTYESDPLSI